MPQANLGERERKMPLAASQLGAKENQNSELTEADLR